MLFKTIIIIAMLAILFSLFRSLYLLMTSKAGSKKAVKALSWRIGLAIGLFVLLIVGALMGWIEPQGLPIVKES